MCQFHGRACIWHEPYIACFWNELFADPEMRKKYPNLHLLKAQLAKVNPKESFEHYFDGGNLKPMSYFDYDWTQEQLSKALPIGKKFFFVKELALSIIYHLDKLPKVPFKHTFLIRDPHRSAESSRRHCMSVRRHIGKPEGLDMYDGNPLLDLDRLPGNPAYELYRYVKANIDPNPVVIDADDLQTCPEHILKKYCNAVNIPFKESYLNWERSDNSLKCYYGCTEKMLLGIQMKNVFDKAFASTCFNPTTSPKPSFEDLTPDGQRYVLEMQEGYKEMYKSRIKP